MFFVLFWDLLGFKESFANFNVLKVPVKGKGCPKVDFFLLSERVVVRKVLKYHNRFLAP